MNSRRIDFIRADTKKPENLLLVVAAYAQPVLDHLLSTVHRITRYMFNSHIYTCLIYLLFLPMFLMTTFITGLISILLNHIIRPQEMIPSHQRPLASSSHATEEITTTERENERPGMEYWLERCSICFDARLELCLDHCRDQYCLDCFRRYIIEVVMSSWGLTVTKIKCPVCQIPIPQSEWSQFVPAHVVEHYNRYNRPYRSYSRCCPSCETEAVPCHYEERSSNESHPTVASIIHNLVESDPYRYDTPQVRHLIVLYQQQKWHSTALPDIYKHTMRTLMECSGPQWHEQMLAISRRVLMLEMKPEIWKQLQFAHISFFPTHACLTCGTCFCLKCGRESHTEMSCEESIRHLLDSEKSSENRETVRWTLDYSQQCPSCSILIHRDEGCNKVDCSLCGFCFCWVCRSSWSEKCGFYQCSLKNENNCSLGSTDSKTEPGVPNVSAIQARLLGTSIS